MSEPRYDEDVVNLGYLNKVINNELSENKQTISKHYATKPNTPYYAGDTWSEGRIVYTCIKTRLIGVYDENDWTTESGAKEEAEKKNKTFLIQPSNYNVGDMWILQSDIDHKSGKRGEILISTVGRSTYNENDWVNMLSYGNITNINEVLNELNIVVNEICFSDKEKIETTVNIFYSLTEPEAKENDFWYKTDDGTLLILENHEYATDTGEVLNSLEWQQIIDSKIIDKFKAVNEVTLTDDGIIHCFYTDVEPVDNIGVGDIWENIQDKNVYRYNGTNWVSIYATKVSEILKEIETITKRNVEINTDFGEIKQTVSETTTKLNNEYLTAEQIEAENQTLKDDIDILKEQQTTVTTTAEGLQVQIDTINNEGVRSVKNTTVDINENGITIGKSNSEFSANMNNTGTYMYAFGKQIAKYDKDGVETEDFKATGEVDLGYIKIIKGETNGAKRTHIHFVG